MREGRFDVELLSVRALDKLGNISVSSSQIINEEEMPAYLVVDEQTSLDIVGNGETHIVGMLLRISVDR